MRTIPAKGATAASALLVGAAALLLATATPAVAQSPAAQAPAGCRGELAAFRAELRDDGLWLGGFRTSYGWPAAREAMRHDQTVARTGPGLGEIGDLSGPSARARAADVQAQGGGALRTTPGDPADAPWRGLGWRMPPMQELRALHDAALVMARRGEEQGCLAILAELRETRAAYAEQLRRAGITEDRIGEHRRRLLATARPVAEFRGALRSQGLIGADVRSPRDVYLGSIEDVMFDSETGRIDFVILARGGFIGIGEDYVAVPWRHLRAAPTLDLLVMDTTAQALDAAPKVESDSLGDAGRATEQRRLIERYWQAQPG